MKIHWTGRLWACPSQQQPVKDQLSTHTNQVLDLPIAPSIHSLLQIEIIILN